MENTCYTLFRRSYHTLYFGNHLELFISQQGKKASRTIIPRLPLSCTAGEDQTNDSYQGRNINSSSSSHHRYHRSSYEHKRSRSEKGKERFQKSTVNESPLVDLGISHYQRLNIQPDADMDTIKSAYYSLSKIYHPDIADPADAKAVENFRLITESYNTLSDPQLKAHYDRQINVEPIRNFDSEIYDQGLNASRDGRFSFRVKDADMLFRAKQESAMERDKQLNPKKFRAGSFKESTPDENFDAQDEINRIKRRLDILDKSNMGTNSIAGDKFYQTHLYISIQRRHAGLVKANSMSYHGGASNDSGMLGIVAGLGIIAVVGLSIFNLLVNYDIGGYLDSKLEFANNKSYGQGKKE